MERSHDGAFSRGWGRAAISLMAILSLGAASAQNNEPKLHPAPADDPKTNSPLKEIEPGIFALGNVRLNKKLRALTFPAVVNMTQGAVEYALVTATGKIHESVLRTDVAPYHIHLAALLLGAKGAPLAQTGGPGGAPSAPGDPASIWVGWRSGGEEKRRRIEDMIFNSQTKSVMSRGDWVYNGSRVAQGVFLAQRLGSIVAIMDDPDALLNNPRPGRENDKIWEAYAANTPPAETPVQVTIQLEAEKK